MTTPVDPYVTTPAARFFGAIRRTGVVRTSDRMVGGVAAGLAHRCGMSPGLMRLLLVLGVVLLGLSLWCYPIAWVLLPDQRDGHILLERWSTGASPHA